MKDPIVEEVRRIRQEHALRFGNDLDAIFEDIKKSKALIYTSDYVIDETITAIMARSNHKQSVLAGAALFTSKIIKIIHVSADHFHLAWELYQKYKDKMFSFTDAASFVIMKGLGIGKAFSFDREFVQAGIE